MRAARWLLAPLMFLPLVVPHPAYASKKFDFIYSDEVDITLCPQCGVTLTKDAFGLLVNTGDSAITTDELSTVHYTVTSSRPEIVSFAWYHPVLGIQVGPVQPGEAVGSVYSSGDLLTSLVRSDETFRNTQPEQTFVFSILRPSLDTWEGDATLTMLMTMAGRGLRFDVRLHVHYGGQGEISLDLIHAARASSVPITDAVATATWGRLRRMYGTSRD